MQSQVDENVKVCVRARPMSSKESSNGSRSCISIIDSKSVIIGDKVFHYDYVADDQTSQV